MDVQLSPSEGSERFPAWLEPFGGALLFASVPGAGTRVTLEVPL